MRLLRLFNQPLKLFYNILSTIKDRWLLDEDELKQEETQYGSHPLKDTQHKPE